MMLMTLRVMAMRRKMEKVIWWMRGEEYMNW
jgi:hypothetical protein